MQRSGEKNQPLFAEGPGPKSFAGRIYRLMCETLPPRPSLTMQYLWNHRRLPNFNQPSRFTELIQVRKLMDRDPRLPRLADKIAVKDWVRARLGDEWIIPTLWAGTRLPGRPEWPLPFVVKPSNGCRQVAFIRTGEEDWEVVRRAADGWMHMTYGSWNKEWLYEEIEPRLLVEPFIGRDGKVPLDYKFHVFGGHCPLVEVHTGRNQAHRRTFFDREWTRQPFRAGIPTDEADLPAPRSLPAMLHAAETLAREFDYARVDFYEIDNQPLFGEITFYPASGMRRFHPERYDVLLGQWWLDARNRQTNSKGQ